MFQHRLKAYKYIYISIYIQVAKNEEMKTEEMFFKWQGFK